MIPPATDTTAAAKTKKRKPSKPQPALPIDYTRVAPLAQLGKTTYQLVHTAVQPSKPTNEYRPKQHQPAQLPGKEHLPAAHQHQQPQQQQHNHHPAPVQQQVKVTSYPVQEATAAPKAVAPKAVGPTAPNNATAPTAPTPAAQGEACCCAMSLLVFSTGEWCVAARRCDIRGVTLVEHWLTGEIALTT